MSRRVVGSALAAVLLGGSGASAQTGTAFNRTGSGARAAGMANAFIAVSDDGTAASWNPAGLGQLRKPEFSVVSSTLGQSFGAEGFRTRDDLASFSSAHSSYQSTYLDFASLAVPVSLWKKAVTFQASWRRLYTIDYREVVSITREPLVPEGPPPIRIDSNSDLVGSVNVLSISGAVKVTPRLALGGSFNFWRGDWTEDNAVSETPLDGGESEFLMANQTNRVRGTNFTLGLMLTYSRASVGLVYQDVMGADFTVMAERHQERNASGTGADVRRRAAVSPHLRPGRCLASRAAVDGGPRPDLGRVDRGAHRPSRDRPRSTCSTGSPRNGRPAATRSRSMRAPSASSSAKASSSPSASARPGSRREAATPIPAMPSTS